MKGPDQLINILRREQFETLHRIGEIVQFRHGLTVFLIGVQSPFRETGTGQFSFGGSFPDDIAKGFRFAVYKLRGNVYIVTCAHTITSYYIIQ